MADIKFSEFSKATTSKDSDEIAILQDGVNKMIPSPVLESKIINKTVSRVIDQGGSSLNLINPIGVVPTYADLALIIPTPELNDAYQVEADGLVYVYTENGFQADGDGFIVQSEPTGVVEEENTEAVSGGEVYEKLEPISTDINNIKDNIKTETHIDISTPTYIGYYFNRSALTKVEAQTASAGFNAMLFNVNTGDKYIASALLGGATMAMAIFYDELGNKVSHILTGDSSQHNDVEIIVPDGAAELIFSWRNTSPASISFIGYNISDKVNLIEQKISETNSDIISFKNEITEYRNIYDYDSIGVVSGVISTSGTLTSAGFSTGLIPVKSNHYYYLNNRNINAIKSIRAIGSNGVTRSKVLVASTGLEAPFNYYLSDGLSTLSNGMFKTPENASFVQISLTPLDATELNEDWKITLEEVGDTYNPDYKPLSTFLEYKITIKDDALEYSLEEIHSKVDNSVKVLLIGSSHGMNTIGQFPILAYHSGVDVICANAYQGSLSVQQVADYCNNGNTFGGWYKKFENGVWVNKGSRTMLQMLQDEKWDFISLQRSASEDMTWNAEQEAAFETILEFITENTDYTPKIVFNSGFADRYSIATRPQQQADTEVIWSTAQNVYNYYGIEIIPMAPALQEIRNDDTLATLGVTQMLTYDSQHLDDGIGQYVSGCITYNFFLKHLNKSILTNRYLPNAEDMQPFHYSETSFTPIEEQYAKEIRRIVNVYFSNH